MSLILFLRPSASTLHLGFPPVFFSLRSSVIAVVRPCILYRNPLQVNRTSSPITASWQRYRRRDSESCGPPATELRGPLLPGRRSPAPAREADNPTALAEVPPPARNPWQPRRYRQLSEQASPVRDTPANLRAARSELPRSLVSPGHIASTSSAQVRC